MNRDSRIVEIELEKIVPNRFQPRKAFTEDISELAESIRAHGVLQPITVRPLGEKFEIVMGERRYRACEKLGMHKIPCMIVEMNDHEAMEVALIENLQRQDLNPIEEALSYKKILGAGYITQDQLAQRIGKTQSTIANKLRLLSLEKEVQEALLKNEISERHARSLLKLSDRKQQLTLLNRIMTEKLTVKRTDDEIVKMLNEEPEESEQEDGSVEIIDFDDNPFVENSNEPKLDDALNPDLYSSYNSATQNKDYVEQVLNNKPLMEPQNKPKIPTKGIVDDFDNPDDSIVAETNHGFNDATNGENGLDNLNIDADYTPINKVEETPEEQESVDLVNVEPDSIDIAPEEVIDEVPNKVEAINEVSSKPINANFGEIKAVIDKCQAELNRLGYNVRLENFDFEKAFEIIMKVDKK